MRITLGNRISNFRRDPYYPTALPLALVLGVRDWVWYQDSGLARRFKPSQFNNPVSWALNRSLFDVRRTAPRPLKVWERALLALGF